MSLSAVLPVRVVHGRVQRGDTGKVLGHVTRQGRVWRASASKIAFLGDGPGGPEPLGDYVPLALYRPLADVGDPHLPGEFGSQREAITALQRWLVQHRAPVMGFGPHADVIERGTDRTAP